ncbi:MAG: cytochrome c-type biogenesis protein CcmH [Azospirillaceae bacterium]
MVLALAAGPLVAAPPGAALAVEPEERLADPALEERARELSAELRCLVCQNQSIDDSNAPLARDLRVLVRERLLAGDTNDEVMAFVTDRYGDYVLLRPPMKTTTLLLWFGPVFVLVVAAGAVMMMARRRLKASLAPPPLDEAERRRLDALLKDGDAPEGRAGS